MPRIKPAAVAAALILSAGAASAQIYPLTNGPTGTGSNTIDSARGWDGINAVAPERELLYHPERAGNAAATYRAWSLAGGDAASSEVAPTPRRARHRRRHEALR